MGIRFLCSMYYSYFHKCVYIVSSECPSDATDLKDENADLLLQNRKWSEDYKDLRIRLEEAEDKNSALEVIPFFRILVVLLLIGSCFCVVSCEYLTQHGSTHLSHVFMFQEQNKVLQSKLTCSKEASEKAKAELQREVSELTEALENIKERNSEYVSRISRLEKEYHDSLEEKSVLCADVSNWFLF